MIVNTMLMQVSSHKTIHVSDDVLACCSPIAQSALSEFEANDIAQIFSALSDPVRLRMFSMIASQQEVCSCALEEPLAKSQPTISHHTRLLAQAGLIVGERRGRWMWWRVVPGRMGQIAQLLAE